MLHVIESLIILALLAAASMLFIKKEAIRKHRLEIIAGLLVFITVLLPFHQHFAHHFWFDIGDFWHHETIEGCCIALAVGLLLGKYLSKRQNPGK
jgi:protein-S-isoprenylcysteine O-methyltransferase Ste14